MHFVVSHVKYGVKRYYENVPRKYGVNLHPGLKTKHPRRPWFATDTPGDLSRHQDGQSVSLAEKGGAMLESNHDLG